MYLKKNKTYFLNIERFKKIFYSYPSTCNILILFRENTNNSLSYHYFVRNKLLKIAYYKETTRSTNTAIDISQTVYLASRYPYFRNFSTLSHALEFWRAGMRRLDSDIRKSSLKVGSRPVPFRANLIVGY